MSEDSNPGIAAIVRAVANGSQADVQKFLDNLSAQSSPTGPVKLAHIASEQTNGTSAQLVGNGTLQAVSPSVTGFAVGATGLQVDPGGITVWGKHYDFSAFKPSEFKKDAQGKRGFDWKESATASMTVKELAGLRTDVGKAVSTADAANAESGTAKSTADHAASKAAAAESTAGTAESTAHTASDQAVRGQRTAGEALGKAATALTKVETAFKKADGAISQAHKALNRLDDLKKQTAKTASENTATFKALEKSIAEITARLGEH